MDSTAFNQWSTNDQPTNSSSSAIETQILNLLDMEPGLDACDLAERLDRSLHDVCTVTQTMLRRGELEFAD